MLKLKDIIYKLEIMDHNSIECEGDVREIIDSLEKNFIQKPWFVFQDLGEERHVGGMNDFKEAFETKEDAEEYVNAERNHYDMDFVIEDIRTWGQEED